MPPEEQENIEDIIDPNTSTSDISDVTPDTSAPDTPDVASDAPVLGAPDIIPSTPTSDTPEAVPDTNAPAPQAPAEFAPLGTEATPPQPEQTQSITNKSKLPQIPGLDKLPKKKIAMVSVGIVAAIVVVFGLLPAVLQGLSPNGQQQPPEELIPEESNNLVPVESEEKDGYKTYTSPNFEFTIRYPAKAKFLEPGTYDAPLETYRIIFSGERQNRDLNETEDIVDGYILNFTIHKNIINQNIDSLTLEKRNSYIILCGDNTMISEITKTVVSGYDARRFEVQNCGVDYIQTLFLREGDLFEINQAYRGDIGFRQVYKAETNEIVSMFKITNTLQPTPTDTWKEYEVKNLFKLKHPTEYDSTCCTMSGPIDSSAEKIVVFADPKTVANSQNNQFNGFGVFVEENRGGMAFNEYVDQQKNLLQENYRIVVGLNPIVDSETKEINGVTWVILRGYAWWGNLAFAQIPDKKEIAVFVRTELPNSDIDFDEVFMDVLETVEFGTQ